MRRGAFFLTMSALVAGALCYRPEGGPPVCTSKRFLGVSCPGCGMLRSVTAFAQGRWQDSLGYHLFGPLAFAAIVTLWGIALITFARRRAYRTPRTPVFNSTLGVTLVLLLGYWAARVATGAVP